MTDDKRPGDGDEDLFEDLDKFFAPIQGVDWPDPDEESFDEPARAAEEEVPEPSTAAYEADTETTVETDEPETDETDDEAAFQLEEYASGGDGGDGGGGGGVPAEDEVTDQGLIVDEGEPESVEVVAEIEDEDTGSYVTLDEGEYVEPEMGVMEGAQVPAETEAAAEHFAAAERDTPEDVEREILSDLDEPAPETVSVTASEGLQGPSWQEPTHEEIGAPEGGGSAPAGRNVPLAFITGAGMALVALGALWLSKDLFAVLAGLVVLFGQAEFYGAIRKRHYQPAPLIGLVFGALVLAAGYLTKFAAEETMLAMVVLALVFCFLWEMATPAKFRRNIVANIGATMLGIIYIPLCAGFGMLMLAFVDPSGRAVIIAVLGLTFLYDTVAFVVGSLFGEHQLAPHVSPRKSWEGAAAASLAVVLVSFLFVRNLAGVEWQGATALAVVVLVMAPLGDLLESLLKRDLGIKDMGTILPGHGGVLDRIDSVLLVLPVAAFLLQSILY